MKVTSNTLYSRHSLVHRDSPTITEHAGSPRVHPRRHRRAAAAAGGCQVMLNGESRADRVQSSIHFSPLISPAHTQCHPAQKNSSERQRRRRRPQSDGSAAHPPSGKKQPTSSARSVHFTQIQHLAADGEHAGCRRIQDRQQVARVRPGLRKVRLWYTIYMSMYMYVYT